MEHLKAYQEHVIDQALTVLSANHDIKCMFTTPKLLDALANRLEKEVLVQRLRNTMVSTFASESLRERAEHNWYVLFGESLPT